MIVSISRELGAGGGSVGEVLAGALGATLLDERAIIDRLADRHGISSDFLTRTCERPPSFGESLIADLARASAMLPFNTEWRMPDDPIIERVRALVFECAERGHVVVIGHGGVSLLGWRPAGVRVLAILLQASVGWRIEQLARRCAIDAGEAQRRIARTDEARRRYLRHYFNCDMYDSRRYDLVLNTERLGLDLAIALATNATLAAADERAAKPATLR
ncbi:MAG: cytidylate kinase-like family protein [Candidatus Velthaea sp.]|jgi:cytidylate kinase